MCQQIARNMYCTKSLFTVRIRKWKNVEVEVIKEVQGCIRLSYEAGK